MMYVSLRSARDQRRVTELGVQIFISLDFESIRKDIMRSIHILITLMVA